MGGIYTMTSGGLQPAAVAPGNGTLLIDNGGSVPAGTPSGTLIFEKGIDPTTWDFRGGSLPAGWSKVGAPTETFSGTGMATTCASGTGYEVSVGTLPNEFSIDLHIVAQTTVSSVMFGPRALSAANAGVGVNWYNSPNAVMAGQISNSTYASAFAQTAAGPPTYPTRLRLHRVASAWYASVSADSGVSWSAESPVLNNAAVPTRIGFGSWFNTPSATVEKFIYTPGPTPITGGRAKGWWDGTTLRPLT